MLPVTVPETAAVKSTFKGADPELGLAEMLHERFGFARVAHLREVGYKFDKWLDVYYYQLLL